MSIARRQLLGVDLRELIGAISRRNDIERLASLPTPLIKAVRMFMADAPGPHHRAGQLGRERAGGRGQAARVGRRPMSQVIPIPENIPLMARRQASCACHRSSLAR